jgi:stage V sporulation protein G
MEITEVRIKLMEEAGERLQAFCSITFDDSFVIRDLKIIEGTNGPFVAMPSRKLTSHCHGCGSKNHLRAAYCNQCGSRLKDDRAVKDEDGRAKLYADIAHPINSACREMIQERVIREFYGELDRAKLPGYVSRYDDIDLDDVTIQMHGAHAESVPSAHHRPHPAREPSAARETHHRPPAQRPALHDRATIQVQTAEQHPRGPHHAPGVRAGASSVGGASATGPAAPAPKPPQQTAARPSPPAASASSPSTPAVVPSGKQDGFGAGIF